MTITLNLTEQQIQKLAGLIDAGVRASGLQAVASAAEIMALLEAAVAAAREAEQQPATTTTTPLREVA
jgi:Spy/CpxP family protein refolding chaperone